MSNELAVKDEDLLVLPEDTAYDNTLDNPGKLLTPRIQVASGTSPEMTKADPKYIKGLELGDLFNTVTQEIYGSEIKFVPFKYATNRILFHNKKQDCTSPEGKVDGHLSPLVQDPTTGEFTGGCEVCEYSQWGTGKPRQDGTEQGYACTQFHNYAVAVIDKDGESYDLASLSFKNSSQPQAVILNSMIKLRKAKQGGKTRELPMYYGQYKLASITKQGDSGPYFVPTVNNDKNPPEKLWEDLEADFYRFKREEIKISSAQSGEENE